MENGSERSAKKRGYQLNIPFNFDLTPDTVDVNVINISKDGMAFKSDYKFKPNTYYDTVVILANKERIATVIEIIRMSNSGDTETTYGCRFVGISKEDQFKIEVYQIVDESKNN